MPIPFLVKRLSSARSKFSIEMLSESFTLEESVPSILIFCPLLLIKISLKLLVLSVISTRAGLILHLFLAKTKKDSLIAVVMLHSSSILLESVSCATSAESPLSASEISAILSSA